MVIDGIVVKGRRIIILVSIQKKALVLLHVNHFFIPFLYSLYFSMPHGYTEDETISIYWINIIAELENAIKNCPAYLHFQVMQPKGKTLSHELPGRL